MPQLPAGPARGAIVLLLIVANTLMHGVPIVAIAVFKLVVPSQSARARISRLQTTIAERWIAFNTQLLHSMLPTRWQLQVRDGLKRDGWYLVIANHRSWVDILVLQAVLNRRIPLLKFFIKQQLRWVPLLGLAWWALDMPFVKRYSRAQVARRPELRGVDVATMRRACARFREQPTSVLNFVEGTRYTAAKRARTGSQYAHLLNPRAGGIAFVLGAMRPMLNELLDVTIAYPAGGGGLWDLCCGRIREIVVTVERQPLEAWLSTGDYAADEDFRRRFQQWLGALWFAKDARLAELLGTAGPHR